MILALVGIAAAVEGDAWYWSTVPLPSSAVAHTVAADVDAVWIVDDQGTVWRRDTTGWEQLPAVPSGESPGWLGVGPDGVLWAICGKAVRTFDGRWSAPRTARSDVPITAVVPGGPGSSWVVGQFGHFWRDLGGSWVQRTDIPIPNGSQGSTFGVASDGAGGLLVALNMATAFWVTDGGVTELPRGDTGLVTSAARDDGGRVVLAGDGVRVLDGKTWTFATPEPIDQVVAFSTGWAARTANDTVIEVDGTQSRLPGATRQLAGSPKGSLWAVVDSGLRTLSRGPGPAFHPDGGVWGLGELGDRASVVATDLDADGLHDVVVSGDDGVVRLLYQRANAFENGTTRLPREVRVTPPTTGDQRRYRSVTACDLEGRGWPSLLTWEGDSEATWRFTYLRNHGAWFEDATERAGFAIPGVVGGHVRPRCADVDGDADLDVLVSILAENANAHGVRILENGGDGRLTLLPVDPRGPGSRRWWVFDAIVAQLDDDAFPDMVVLSAWTDGLRLLLGDADKRWHDRGQGSGLYGAYPTPTDAWTDDADGDGRLDLVVEDGGFASAYANLGGGHFADRTDLWGLWPVKGGDAPAGEVSLADLDGDGRQDVIVASSEGINVFGSRGGPGWHDRSDVVPPGLTGAQEAIAIDLGGDGDTDLIVLSRGPDHVLINDMDPGKSILTSFAARRSSFGWLRGVDVAALIALVGLLVLAQVQAAAPPIRLVLGRPWLAALVGGAGSLGWVSVLDARPWLRALAYMGAAIGLVAGGLVEGEVARRRRQRVVGKWRLERVIGSGGMGDVFAATDIQTGDRVALKTLRAALVGGKQGQALFEAEVEALRRVSDPRVVRMVGAGRWEPLGEEPVAFVVMELLDGQSLRAVLRPDQALPAGQAAAVGAL